MLVARHGTAHPLGDVRVWRTGRLFSGSFPDSASLPDHRPSPRPAIGSLHGPVARGCGLCGRHCE